MNIVLRGPEKVMEPLRWDHQNLVAAVFPLLNPQAHPGYQRGMKLKQPEGQEPVPDIPDSQEPCADGLEFINAEDCEGQIIHDPITAGYLLCIYLLLHTMYTFVFCRRR